MRCKKQHYKKKNQAFVQSVFASAAFHTVITFIGLLKIHAH